MTGNHLGYANVNCMSSSMNLREAIDQRQGAKVEGQECRVNYKLVAPGLTVAPAPSLTVGAR